MITIWKFPLVMEVEQTVKMPLDARILHLDMQHGRPCLWAMVDRTRTFGDRTIKLAGTGTNDVPHDPYIGTVMDGSFVWHFFDGGYADGN